MPLDDVRIEFNSALVSQVKSKAAMSHEVSRGALRSSNKKWIKKEMHDPATAQLEILAQEFFRLIIPQQPETRLLWDPSTGVHYILSEEVPGYRDLPTGQAANFGNGTYKGLGQAVVAALFVEEIDLKNGNIGLDNQNRVIKIDGDWSFAGLSADFGSQKYNITADVIDKLPYPNGFYAWNWFDIIMGGVGRGSSNIVNMSLSNNSQFRAEVNQAMLKICLLPNDYIGRFVDAFIPAGGQKFVSLLQQRCESLRNAALQNKSFKAYLQSDQAALDAQDLCTQMNLFIANGRENVLKPDLHKQMTDQVHAKLVALNPNAATEKAAAEKAAAEKAAAEKAAAEKAAAEKTAAEKAVAEKAVAEKTAAEKAAAEKAAAEKVAAEKAAAEKAAAKYLNNLVTKIEQHRVNDNDKTMNQFVIEMNEEIQQADLNNRETLEKLKSKLNEVLDAVSSPQVKAVKDAVKSLRASVHWFTRGKLTKANQIEQALGETPLLERKTIISSEGPANKVQEELAKHRHLGKTGRVYKKNDQIDSQKAAQTFKDLKAQFVETKSGEESKQSTAVKPTRMQ